MRQVTKEYNGEKYNVMAFEGEVLSISEKVLENKNNTKYRVATVAFADADGVEQSVSAFIMETNMFKDGVQQIVVGDKYYCEARPTDQGPYITVAPFAYTGNRATNDMFGFSATAEIKENVVSNADAAIVS